MTVPPLCSVTELKITAFLESVLKIIEAGYMTFEPCLKTGFCEYPVESLIRPA